MFAVMAVLQWRFLLHNQCVYSEAHVIIWSIGERFPVRFVLLKIDSIFLTILFFPRS